MLAAGSGVKSVEKGDWVIAKHTGLGTWRTHLQVEEEKLMKVEKEGLRSEQVGTVGVSVQLKWTLSDVASNPFSFLDNFCCLPSPFRDCQRDCC